jgi:hypothetical protein
MSLLLTRHVDQYRIDVRPALRTRFGPHRLGACGGQPLTNELTVKPIMLHHQHALHGWPAR